MRDCAREEGWLRNGTIRGEGEGKGEKREREVGGEGIFGRMVDLSVGRSVGRSDSTGWSAAAAAGPTKNHGLDCFIVPGALYPLVNQPVSLSLLIILSLSWGIRRGRRGPRGGSRLP